MKVLTVRNPWAAALMVAGADCITHEIEAPAALVGERVAIHAPRRYDDHARGMSAMCALERIHRLPMTNIRGAIIGSVKLGYCTTAEDCQLSWNVQRRGGFAWIVTQPRIYRTPIEYRGTCGLFEASCEVAAAEADAPMTPRTWLLDHAKKLEDAEYQRSRGKIGTLD